MASAYLVDAIINWVVITKDIWRHFFQLQKAALDVNLFLKTIWIINT